MVTSDGFGSTLCGDLKGNIEYASVISSKDDEEMIICPVRKTCIVVFFIFIVTAGYTSGRYLMINPLVDLFVMVFMKS